VKWRPNWRLVQDIAILGTGLALIWPQLILWAWHDRSPSDVLMAWGGRAADVRRGASHPHGAGHRHPRRSWWFLAAIAATVLAAVIVIAAGGGQWW
jgi:hypothetical protein